MIGDFDFYEQLKISEGFCNDEVAVLLENRFLGVTSVVRANEQDDRNGTDFWAQRGGGLPPLSIDVKVRSKDYSVHDWISRQRDDLALETWSVINKVPGWTRNERKRSDYILWYWSDTGRFFLVPFPPLCKIFTFYWQEWKERFQCEIQSSRNWKSECVFVPRELVIDTLATWLNGNLNNYRNYHV